MERCKIWVPFLDLCPSLADEDSSLQAKSQGRMVERPRSLVEAAREMGQMCSSSEVRFGNEAGPAFQAAYLPLPVVSGFDDTGHCPVSPHSLTFPPHLQAQAVPTPPGHGGVRKVPVN